MTTKRVRDLHNSARHAVKRIAGDEPDYLYRAVEEALDAPHRTAIERLRKSWPSPSVERGAVRALSDRHGSVPSIELLASYISLGEPPPFEILWAVTTQMIFYIAAEGAVSLDESLLGREGQSVQRAGNYSKRRAAARRNASLKDAAKVIEKHAAKPTKKSTIETLLNDPRFASLVDGLSDETLAKLLPPHGTRSRK